MKHKKMTLAEVVEYIENHDDPFVEFGIRVDSFVPDTKFNNSWYRGDEFDEYELPGVSVIKIMARDKSYVEEAYEIQKEYIKYDNKHVFLLEGECTNADEITHDYGEALMIDHKIVAIIE